MSGSNSDPLILLDSDVIRHFISGGQLHRLSLIYPERFAILDKVKTEICRSSNIKNTVEKFITDSNILEISFPADSAIIIEYAYLRREFGEGESACMAVAKYHKQFIASSNLKDIGRFCKQHNITYLTTMDILLKASEDKILTKDECNQFINDVISKGSKLPRRTLEAYILLKK